MKGNENTKNAILESEIVKLWVRKACGTKTTERVYIPRLIKFLEYYNVTPEEIIDKWKQVRYDWTERQKFIDEWSEKIENYYAMSDHAPLTKLSEIAPIKSFFNHSKIPIEVQTKKHAHTIYHNRDIAKSELRRILEHSGLREKVFFLMMGESGLRPRTLVQLKYRDIREDFEANRIPMKINLRPEIVKDAVSGRFTFIGQEAFNVLKEYLSTKYLSDDDYIFSKKVNRYDTEFICPEAFSTYFARVLQKIKLRDVETQKGKPRRIRLYCLRKYFRKNMRCPDTNYREFWMCHSFGTDEHYISRDAGEHRKQYMEGYPYLRVYEGNEQPTSETVQLLAKELDNTKKKLRKFESIFNDRAIVINKSAIEKLMNEGKSKEQLLDLILSETKEHT